MSRKLLLICAGGALALATAACAAVAAPLDLGPAHPSGGDNSLQTLVRSGGMHGGFGGMSSGHAMGAPHFYGHPYVSRGISRTHFAGRGHHRHNRFFFVGYPYYYDDDYYYGYDSCWWSRPRHRWVCGYY